MVKVRHGLHDDDGSVTLDPDVVLRLGHGRVDRVSVQNQRHLPLPVQDEVLLEHVVTVGHRELKDKEESFGESSSSQWTPKLRNGDKLRIFSQGIENASRALAFW